MFENEGYQFMGAAFEVYNQLGYGMAEEIYQESLECELLSRSIPFLSKPHLATFYKAVRLNAYYRPDLIVFGGIIIELKAVSSLTTDHYSQLLNYLRVARMHVGYLINFGQKNGLEWKRFILSQLHVPRDDAQPTQGVGNADDL